MSVNTFLNISRKESDTDNSSQTTQTSFNEYLPIGFVANNIYSKSLKTLYVMPKIDPEVDWSNSLDFNINLQVELLESNHHMYGSGKVFNYYVFPNETGLNIIKFHNEELTNFQKTDSHNTNQMNNEDLSLSLNKKMSSFDYTAYENEGNNYIII